ncbi:MAG TPA: ABC transporter permease [Gammaproteobacteria bacterium]
MAMNPFRPTARVRAIIRAGSASDADGERRDTRGAGWFDAVMRDLVYACRSLRSAPLVALTVVTTVGLGLGLVAAVFTIFNAVIFRVDEVRNPQELFAVTRQAPADSAPEKFTREQYEALLRETDAFVDAFALGPEVDRIIDGQRIEGQLVSGNFFQVLGVSAARGRTLVPADDETGNDHVIVLSGRAWSRYFASDPGVLNRTIDVNGVPFQIVGVMPEGFRGLAFAPPDFWAPLSLLGELRPNSDSGEPTLGIVGRLAPGLTRGQALAQLVAWDVRRAVETSGERPDANLVLEPRQGTVPLSAEAIVLFMPLFFAFGLILMIGCANVANLLLARAVARRREIGIRLAIGATRRRIIAQLLTESLLLALVSAALGFGVSRLVLEAVVYYVTTAWANLGDIRLVVPPADWRVALFLVIAALASTLFFALAPALQATRFDLVRPMHGEAAAGEGRPGRARNALVALQVTGSVLLFVTAAVFLRSSWVAASLDPGIRTTDTVFVNVASERRGAMLDAVRSEPSVASVAAATPFSLSAAAQGAVVKPNAAYRFVSPNYFEVLGIEIARGRGFAPTETSSAAAVAVVSESAAEQLWPGLDAIGQLLRLDPGPEQDAAEREDAPLLPRTAVVVGVARDVPGFRLAGQSVLAGPDVYLPIAAEAAGTSLALRVRGNPSEVSRRLLARLETVEAGAAEIIPLRELSRMEAELLAIPFWITFALGALALFLTLSGLFSVLSYLVERRRREIGVRMALGATRRGIGALVLAQTARPVAVGLLLGSSFPAAVGAALLATPLAEQIGQTVRLLDPLAYAAGLLCVVTACAFAALVPVLRAGRVDPIAALRQD